MIEYQFGRALEKLHQFLSDKKHFDEVKKALDYNELCNIIQCTRDEQKARRIAFEILEYYKAEINWLSAYENPFLSASQQVPQNHSFWVQFDFLKQMIPFYCLIRIGKSELIDSFTKRNPY